MVEKHERHSGYGRLSYESVSYKGVQYSPSQFSSANDQAGGDVKNTLMGKINRKDATVGVVGLGYVGLPLAVTFAEAGYRVIGVDLNPEVSDGVNGGRSHVGDISSERLLPLVEKGRLVASAEYGVLERADCIFICVPTPLTKSKEPNISYITGALDRLVPSLRRGMLVVLESTTYPGTTEELIAERVERELQLEVGKEIFIAFSPERVDPGNSQWYTRNTPKVLGGVTPTCTEVGRSLYASAVDKVHTVSSAREAETVKLLENTFRAVNIGLVNEFTLMCDRLGIDIWRVIEAAGTKPFGFMPFHPGPGIGGHCIPLDPLYLSWKAKAVDFYNRFIELATDINGNMPRYVVQKISDLLNEKERSVKGASILLLGMAYKKNVGDVRESPGIEIYRLLCLRGARAAFFDPHVDAFDAAPGESVSGISLDAGIFKEFDATVLVTDHDGFDYRRIAAEAPAILDCRNAFGARGISGAHIAKL